jgi:hypothetical protein
VRRELDLREDQKLVALLFDHDEVIELLYRFPGKVIELAKAGFDLVVSASYSIWEPRPRLHNLRNMVRSLDLCIALQKGGAAAIPRFDWQIEHDVRRWVEWLNSNPSVETAAIDAMTCATNGWSDVLEGLEMLDRLSGQRLHYIVNGPSVNQRREELFGLIPQNRLTLTDAGPISAPPTPQEELDFPGPFAEIFGPRLRARILRQRLAVIRAAARAA